MKFARFLVLLLALACLVGCPTPASNPSTTTAPKKFGSTSQVAYVPNCTGGMHVTAGAQDGCFTASSGGGWVTDMDCDLTAESNQTFSTDGTYTICGLTWKKENSASETTHSSVINGTGLEFTNYGFGAYGSHANLGGGGDSERSSPLLWMALSQLAITDLDWSTQFRIWVDVPTQTLDSSGVTGFAFGIDNDVGTGFGTNTTWYSLFGARACSSATQPVFIAWEYTGNPSSSASTTSAPSGVTTWNSSNQTSVAYLGSLVPIDGTYQPVTMFGPAWSSSWTNTLVPWGTRQDQPGAALGAMPSIGFANNAGSPATIGSKLGVVLAFTGNKFIAVPTIIVAHLRIDHRL